MRVAKTLGGVVKSEGVVVKCIEVGCNSNKQWLLHRIT